VIIKNRFSRLIDDARLAALVTFAADGIALGDDVLVELSTSTGLDGDAAGLFRTPPYGWDTKVHPGARYYLRAAFRSEREIADGSHYPCTASRVPNGAGFNHLDYLDCYAPLPPVQVASLEEELVYIFGHECFHLDQHRRDEAADWRLYELPDGGTDHDRIEREAEEAGQARLAAFRRSGC
jgi:hypothetical protein